MLNDKKKMKMQCMCGQLNFQFEINQTSNIVSQMQICIDDFVVQFSIITKE